MKRFLTVICLLTAIGISCNGWAASHISIGDLKCENLKSPLAIDNTSPHFSWKMYSPKNGASTSAYQIIVASSLKKLNEKNADLWNSGKVESDESINIKYDGKALSSRSQGWWKVRVWDNTGKPSKWSEPSSFGVGLLAVMGVAKITVGTSL